MLRSLSGCSSAPVSRWGLGALSAQAVNVAIAAGAATAALSAARIVYQTRVVARPELVTAPVLEPVSVLVPARDEAERIGPCLRSLLAQECVEDLEIVVLDDCSTDGTGAIARAIAGSDPRVRVLRGTELPAGWVGKPHACTQLATAARGSVLVFVDADVTLAPHALAAAVTMLRARELDLLSPFPRQLAHTVAERLYQPLNLWVWILSAPVLDERGAHEPTSCQVNGQFVVVDREAYDKVGGHTAIREALVEDYALGAVFRAAGRRGGAVDGSALAACRMYAGWADLHAGYTRWLGLLVPSRAKFAVTLAVLGTTYLLPPLAALRGSRVGLFGYLAGVAGRAVAARRFGERTWPDAAAHPVSIALVCAFVTDSRRRRARGRTSWKGRPV